jgi:hypothetical protein
MFDPSTPRRLVAAAAALIVESVRHTHYQHDPVIDPATGTYDLDCSEFVSYVLHGAVPRQYAQVPKRPGARCPRAFEYCDYFRGLAADGRGGFQTSSVIDGALVYESARGWRPVASLNAAREGDIVAWRLAHPQPGQDTGHVFVVAERPVDLAAGLVAVRAYDSSDVPHFDDSRSGAGEFRSGVGSGTLHFEVDQLGAPRAVRFGAGDRFHAHRIAIGRLVPAGE